MKRNAEDGENAEEDAEPGRGSLRVFSCFSVFLIKMLHRSGFAIPLRSLRLCGYFPMPP